MKIVLDKCGQSYSNEGMETTTHTNMKRTHLLKHTFTGNDYKGEPCTVASYGDTPAEAARHISGGEENWAHVGTEEVPYTFAERAHAVADALPGEWTAEPSSKEHAQCGWILERADGLRLWMNGPSYSHKNAFSFALHGRSRANGCAYVEVYDPVTHRRVAHPSINCGEGKSSELMAKDIARRLLPEAERVHGLIVAKLNAETDFAAKRTEALKSLCSALGVALPTATHSEEARFSGYADGVEFQVHSGDSVTLKFRSVSLKRAIAIAKQA